MKKVGLISILVAVCVFANPLDEIAGKIGNTSEAITDGINKGKDVIDGIVGGATDKLDGLLGGKIRGINGNIDKLDKIVDQVQNSPFGKCYVIPEPNLDFCSLIPDMEASFDVCSILPNLPGLKKKSYGISQDESPLREFCRQRNKGYNVIPELQTDTILVYGAGGNSKDDDYFSPNGKGNFDRLLKKNTLANTALLQFDQEKIYFIKKIGKGIKKEIDELKIEDIVSTVPETQKDYNNKRQVIANAQMDKSIEYSPKNFSLELGRKIKNISNPIEIERIVSKEVQRVHKLLDAEAQARINFELSKAFNKDYFVATPTKEYISVLREDIKVDNTLKIDKQMNKEAEIIKDINLEYKKKKDIITLTAEKVVVMNVKFDRNLAKAEVEALIR